MPGWIITIAFLVLAVIVGQTNPFLGGLIATFPVKIFGYALSTDRPDAMGGLLAGAVGSVVAASALLAFASLEAFPRLLLAAAAWGMVSLIGAAFLK